MKSTRLTKVQGTFMGIPFQVKPVPVSIQSIEKAQREMLMGWYEEHHPSVKEKLEGGVDIDDFSIEEVLAIGAWKEDVEFRSRYLRFLAESSMQFEKPVPDEYWASEELPYSTIRESWDFFTERRSV